jgi:hypothetical protein
VHSLFVQVLCDVRKAGAGAQAAAPLPPEKCKSADRLFFSDPQAGRAPSFAQT